MATTNHNADSVRASFLAQGPSSFSTMVVKTQEVVNSLWNRAVVRVENQSLEETWDVIIDALNAVGSSATDDQNGDSLGGSSGSLGGGGHGGEAVGKKTMMPSSAKESTYTNLDHAARKLFEQFDTDGNMTLDLEELNEGLESIGTTLTQRQLSTFKKNVIRDIDKDGNGEVDFEEFMATINVLVEGRKRSKVNNPCVVLSFFFATHS